MLSVRDRSRSWWVNLVYSLSPVLCCLDILLLVILNLANCDMVL